MKYLPVFLLIFGSFISCQYNAEENERLSFNPPQIVNTQYSDTVRSYPFEATNVTEVFPIFAGKYKLQDQIDINPEKSVRAPREEYFPRYSEALPPDSVNTHGLELFVDYETTIKYNSAFFHDSIFHEFYPVFFANTTPSDKLFLGKDSYAFGIQEAVVKHPESTSYNWRPIEGRGFDFCGNGYWSLLVHPQEFILILMRKYKGDYSTKLRVRFALGESILVSNPFKGIINEKQFNVSDSSYLGRRLQSSDGNAANSLFYGAVPRKNE